MNKLKSTDQRSIKSTDERFAGTSDFYDNHLFDESLRFKYTIVNLQDIRRVLSGQYIFGLRKFDRGVAQKINDLGWLRMENRFRLHMDYLTSFQAIEVHLHLI